MYAHPLLISPAASRPVPALLQTPASKQADIPRLAPIPVTVVKAPASSDAARGRAALRENGPLAAAVRQA
jgi:hypothetical protein